MKILVDTHTHTIASGHAYSTLNEMVLAAKEEGLEMLAVTEHTNRMPGSPHAFYFHNLRVVPRNMHGIELLMGAELNIIDYNGNVDMSDGELSQLDICIASMHIPCIDPGTIEENTNAMIGAMKNPYVNIIGHPDDGRYKVDYEKVVAAAKENQVLLELNNNSLNPKGFRMNTKENDIKMLELCKQQQVMIAMGSDAHIANDVGNHCYSEEILRITSFPDELIVNLVPERLKEFISQKRKSLS